MVLLDPPSRLDASAHSPYDPQLFRRDRRISENWDPISIESGTAATAGGCIEPFVSTSLQHPRQAPGGVDSNEPCR